MVSKEDIAELKRTHRALEKRMEEIGRNQIPTIVKLSEQLNEIIEDIEAVQERDKSLWNPDISTKIKLAKRGVKVAKKLKYFEDEVVKEFDKGNLSKENGRKFSAVTRQIKDSKLPFAKKEFEKLWKIVELNKKYEISKEETERQKSTLKKEQLRVRNLLAEISRLERQTFDIEKVRKHEELSSNLEKMEELRAAYISSLASRPVAELLGNPGSLREFFPGFKEEGEMQKILDFFSDYPALGKYRVSQVCDMFDFSEKRLSHVCPETTRFKKTILANKNLFETLNALERTSFLAADEEDEKVLDFFAKEIEGARGIVENVRLLRQEKLSCKEEYEKMKASEARKGELSKYSKDRMKRELEEIEYLLELFHSAPEERAENRGLLSKVSSFFKIGK